MLSALEELKIQAKKLLKSTTPPEKLLTFIQPNQPLQLKHCQQFIAQKYGFRHWNQARLALTESENHLTDNTTDASRFSAFWYSPRCATLLNHWCANYADAQKVQAEQGGTILPYKSQFVVADEPYLNCVGLTQNNELLSAINHDFMQANASIRQQLLLKRVLVK
jgi:hypothetical protein